LKLSWQLNAINLCQATRDIRWLNSEQTDVSRTISILVIWELPDDKNGDCSQNIGLFAIQSPDMAGSPKFYFLLQAFSLSLEGYNHLLSV
jgi:hypothetical protein